MRRAALWCTGLGRRGGVDGAASGCLHRCASSSRVNTLFCRNCRRSGMLDLRRFPVSDGAGVKCYTFCTILDRKQNFDFLNYWFSTKGHVTPENMEMPEIAVRIEWKHFRKPAGLASGRNRPLKSRNLSVGHHGTFFQSCWKFEKWEIKKNVDMADRFFSERMEEIWGQSLARRSRYVRKQCSSRTKDARVPDCVRWISHFRPCDFWTVGTPDLHRATRNDGPG